MLSQKYLSIGFVVLSVLLFLSTYSLTTRYVDNMGKSCEVSCSSELGYCPYQAGLPLEFFVGFLVSMIMFGFGVLQYFKKPVLSREQVDISNIPLTEEEKTVMELIVKNNGIFQSRIVEETGYSKVKVTRILDRLESRGLVERKRRGMTNFVVTSFTQY